MPKKQIWFKCSCSEQQINCYHCRPTISAQLCDRCVGNVWAEDSSKLSEKSDDPPWVGQRRLTRRCLSGSELMSCISLVSELRIVRRLRDVGGSRSGAARRRVDSGFTSVSHTSPVTVNEGPLKHSTRWAVSKNNTNVFGIYKTQRNIYIYF